MKKETLIKISPFIVAFAAFLWSLDGLLRVSLYSIPPTVLIFWEHLIGTAIILPFAYKYFGELKTLTRKEWIAILMVSLFSGALGTIFYTTAIQKVNYAQFSIVALLQQLQPIFAITTAAILLKEKLTLKFSLWAVVALGAAYLVTFPDLRVTNPDNVQAGIFALLAGAMWGSSTAFSKIVLKKVSFVTASFLRFALVPIITLVFILGLQQQSIMFTITSAQWLRLLIIALTTGGVALVIYYYGLRNTQAKVSTIAELTWPASAVIIQYLLGTPLTWSQLLGIVILLTAIYNVSKFNTLTSKE